MRSSSFHLNRILLTTLFVALASFGFFFYVSWRSNPEILFDSDRVDFGVISNKEPTVKTVVVRNSGTTTLRIHSISSTCGCTSGVITPSVLAPGAQGALTVTVYPARFLGFDSEKTLFINSNARPANLCVVFKIDPELILEPATLDMGKIAKGASPSARVFVRQAGNEPIELKGVSVPEKDPLLVVSSIKVPTEQWRTPDRAEYVVTVGIRPEAPSGPFATSFLLEGTCTRLPKLRYFVTGEVVAPYRVDPHILTPGRIVPGQILSKTIKISADAALDVFDVVVEGSLSAVAKRSERSGAYEIELSVSPDAVAGFLSAKVAFSVRIEGVVYRDWVRVDMVIVPNAT